jgi:hypothetical protein
MVTQGKPFIKVGRRSAKKARKTSAAKSKTAKTSPSKGVRGTKRKVGARLRGRAMQKPDLSELERIITAAEESKIEAAPAAADRLSALRAIREKAAALVADALPQLDRAALDRLGREHDAELRRLAADAKRHTVESAAQSARRLDALVAAERAAFKALDDEPWVPSVYGLGVVDFIRSWPSPEYLRDWAHQEWGENWAKYAFSTDRGGSSPEKVSFYTMWQNPRDVAIVATILARFTANGHVECSSTGQGIGSWFGITARTRAEVSARLTLWGLWVGPTEPPPLFDVANVSLASISVTTGFFSDSRGESISKSELLSTTGFLIPARAWILIETSLAVDYSVLDGVVNVDFSSQDFSVGAPYTSIIVASELMVA